MITNDTARSPKKHYDFTPTPWSYANMDDENITTASGRTFNIDDCNPYADDRIEHIVKCVNAHDDLVEALKEIASDEFTYDEVFQIAQSSLAKAGVTL